MLVKIRRKVRTIMNTFETLLNSGFPFISVDFPSSAVYIKDPPENGAQMELDNQPPPSVKRKFFLDTTSIHVPRKNGEMAMFLKDGMS